MLKLIYFKQRPFLEFNQKEHIKAQVYSFIVQLIMIFILIHLPIHLSFKVQQPCNDINGTILVLQTLHVLYKQGLVRKELLSSLNKKHCRGHSSTYKLPTTVYSIAVFITDNNGKHSISLGIKSSLIGFFFNYVQWFQF